MAVTNAQVAFGMVNIPVRPRPTMTTREGSVSFKGLHITCGNPVNQDKVCRVCNETLAAEDVVRGFEVTKGQFVSISDAEHDEATADRSPLIVIHKFVAPLDPVWVEKTYWLEANDLYKRQYATFCDALEGLGVVGVGSQALWGKERPVMVSAMLRTLTMSVLHTLPELNEAPAPCVANPSENELELAKQIIGSWTAPIEDSDMTVSSTTKMRALIDAKTSGGQWVSPPAEPVPAPTVDLLAALKETKALRTAQKRRLTKKAA
jgi:DNA end-binding protein Ku